MQCSRGLEYKAPKSMEEEGRRVEIGVHSAEVQGSTGCYHGLGMFFSSSPGRDGRLSERGDRFQGVSPNVGRRPLTLH
jgi:hypothetical protein